MAPSSSQRGNKAMNTMKAIGFPVGVAKPVLKNLLKVYDNNWEYIEAENYSVLADAILEAIELKDAAEPKPEPEPEPEPYKKRLRKQGDLNPSPSVLHFDGPASAVSDEPEPEPEPYRKRLRKQGDQNPSPSVFGSDGPGEGSLRRPKVEDDTLPEKHLLRQNCRGKSIEKTNDGLALQPSPRGKAGGLVSPLPSRSCEKDGPTSTQIVPIETRAEDSALQISPSHHKSDSSALLTYRRDKRPVNNRSENPLCFKEPKVEPGVNTVPVNVMTPPPLRPKDEPVDDDTPRIEVPISMLHPSDPTPVGAEAYGYQLNQNNAAPSNGTIPETNVAGSSGTKNGEAVKEGREAVKENGRETSPNAVHKNASTSELATVQETSSANIDIASSSSGAVKISLTCNSDRPNFRMPNLEDVFKMVEDRCLKSYKILQPDFSLLNLMKEMCQCVTELSSESSDSTDDKQENIVHVTPLLDSLKRSDMHHMFDGMPACSLISSLKLAAPEASGQVTMNQQLNGTEKDDRSERKKSKEPVTSSSLAVVHQPQIALGDVRPMHDASDISKGEEIVRIPVVNEFSNEKFPSCFHYIPRNTVYQNAYVSFSLARIGDEDCCSDCYGDCVAASIPCACARETGGEFAYTQEGLIKKDFLDVCISMNREPQKHPHYYCKVCPLERSKNEVMPDPCKGHLVRKFIKECWRKCGCNKQCGNRVVQRGITCNLQVFYTAEGKGWGLRTLDEIPRGSFVCEYVGEVLTNMELYDRTIQTTGNAKHTYPVLLDADWGSEGVLKDEEALCLDATFYGNVARFVNHRCFDANMVEIPVEVETPDHHYYHLAFFTTRRVQAYEELTWDYGIDFDDHDHPIKAFKCRCGSKFCRDLKRSKARSKAIILK